MSNITPHSSNNSSKTLNSDFINKIIQLTKKYSVLEVNYIRKHQYTSPLSLLTAVEGCITLKYLERFRKSFTELKEYYEKNNLMYSSNNKTVNFKKVNKILQ